MAFALHCAFASRQVSYDLQQLSTLYSLRSARGQPIPSDFWSSITRRFMHCSSCFYRITTSNITVNKSFTKSSHRVPCADASFAENFYSMKRVGKRGRLTRTERLRSLMILVGERYTATAKNKRHRSECHMRGGKQSFIMSVSYVDRSRRRLQGTKRCCP